MLLEASGRPFSDNAGKLIGPKSYEFHWLTKFKDGTEVEMFDASGSPSGRRHFSFVQLQADNLAYAVWRGVYQQDVHFGVLFEGAPKFMVNGKLYQPDQASYYNGLQFIPDLRITNQIPIASNGVDLSLYQARVIYKAGLLFKNIVNGHIQEQSMYLTWDGEKILFEGVQAIVEVGGYTLA